MIYSIIEIVIYTLIRCVILSVVFAVGQEKNNDNYLRWIGDIEFDSKIDDSDFKICNGKKNIGQYFFSNSNDFLYRGEKIAIEDIFKQEYVPVIHKDNTGYIRIRFIVNCKGKTGMFRIIASDNNFVEKKFEEKVINQILNITKRLDGWLIMKNKHGVPLDYYQYLIFRLDEGKISTILP